MTVFAEYAPHFITMGCLLLLSAFFSCSEASLFYLGRDDRRLMTKGGPGQRLAVQLLSDPEYLLSGILFGNLTVNLAYFAIVSMISTRLEQAHRTTEAGGVTFGALVTIILVSEMIPKNLAVTYTRTLAGLLSFPLAAILKTYSPILPVLSFSNELSRRLFFPTFEVESDLELRDLERAITVSNQDENLAHREYEILQSVIALTEMRVEEVMRPRLRYRLFRPRVSLEDLHGQMPPSGYILVSEPDSDEVAGAISTSRLPQVRSEQLEFYAEPVLYIPWCTTAATALEQMKRSDRHVAAVINEHGETIGILTIEDLLETVFSQSTQDSASDETAGALPGSDSSGTIVTGMLTLRHLGKQLQTTFPDTFAVTVSGMLQEELQRLPERGDSVQWGGFHFEVLQAPERGRLTARVTKPSDKGDLE